MSSDTIAVPRAMIERLITLGNALGDPSFVALGPDDNPDEARVVLIDSEATVLAEWQVRPPRRNVVVVHQREPDGSFRREVVEAEPIFEEMHPRHIAETLAEILNLLCSLDRHLNRG